MKVFRYLLAVLLMGCNLTTLQISPSFHMFGAHRRLGLTPFTPVQQQAGGIVTASGNLTASVTLTNVQGGDPIVVGTHTGCPSIVVTDNNGGTYNIAPGAATGMAGYMAVNHPAGTTVVQATVTTVGCFLAISATEFPVAATGTAPTFDVGATSGFATDTTIQTNTITTSGQNPELLFMMGSVDSVQTPTAFIDYGAGGGTPTASANFAQTAASGGNTFVTGWQSVTSTGPYGGQWTVTTAPNLGSIFAIKPSVISCPTIVQPSVCPGGAGIAGYCDLGADTIGNLTNCYVCPSGTGPCTAEATDASTTCTPGVRPSGGGTGQCHVVWSGASWLGD